MKKYKIKVIYKSGSELITQAEGKQSDIIDSYFKKDDVVEVKFLESIKTYRYYFIYDLFNDTFFAGYEKKDLWTSDKNEAKQFTSKPIAEKYISNNKSEFKDIDYAILLKGQI